MEKVGAYEAKTHLPRLLKLVAQGEKFLITRHGVPVATLQAPDAVSNIPAREVIKQIREFRSKHSLEGVSLKEMIEKGRK